MSKVFISYSHDNPEHAKKALAFANQLRADGITSILDQYLNGAPAEGWPLWMEREMQNSEFVLVVCTETYFRRVTGEESPGIGRGVRWESLLTYTDIYESDSQNVKFVPVLFKPEDRAYIPRPLRSTNYYLVTDPNGYEKLYRKITNQPEVIAPRVGARRELGTTDVLDFFDLPSDNNADVEPIPIPDRSEERKTLQENIRKLVQRNRIKEALNTLLEKLNPDSDFNREIDTLLANWDEMLRSERLGIKSNSEISLERNKIVFATLQIVGDITDKDLK